MHKEEIKEKIRQYYNKIPSRQKKIADYVVEHFDRIPFLNIHELAKDSSSSEASIVRYAQRMGYGGFKELQDEIAETLQNKLANNDLFTVPELKNDVLSSVAQQDVKNINDTLALIKRTTFNKAVSSIVSSDIVYTAGLGISYLLAEILSYQLNQIGVQSAVFRQGSTEFAEQILYMKKNDLLI
ncbi:MAG: MurR/RpiR family transcriptional regulator, partial [Bacteroidetes bacterium]|nr:MurR/RpiR family transcriptional regulator [Bacteroidota bacterium]